jgi:hypothetical protein
LRDRFALLTSGRRSAAAPSNASRDTGLELRPANRFRASAAAAPGGLLGRLFPRRCPGSRWSRRGLGSGNCRWCRKPGRQVDGDTGYHRESRLFPAA